MESNQITLNVLSKRWHRRLHESGMPAYLLIPQLIAEDIQSAQLSPRDRLPTLRELARMLELNYTTVARAYAEARNRGLIDTHAGLGTFVRGRSPSLPLRNGTGAEMTMNMPPEPDQADLQARMREGAARALEQTKVGDLMRYQDFGGTLIDKEAALHWLRRRISGVTVDQILVCPGIHSVLTALISQLARAGESICVDSLVYPGLKAIASQLGVLLHPLTLDENGPDVSAFEHACKTLKPKAVYCNPTLLNPTAITMSLSRREVLADVALRYNVPIIEDDAYAMLPRRKLPPVATFAPELTYYITGFSKCLGAGLRTAYVCAPSVKAAQQLSGTLRAMTVMASPITTQIATSWIADGTADAVLQAIREECAARHAIASTVLKNIAFMGSSDGFHLWIELDGAWSPVEFASYMRTQGVGVVASAAFSTDGDPPNAARVCLGGPMSRSECERSLKLLADTLSHPGHPHATFR